jgi:hypothetical protein
MRGGGDEGEKGSWERGQRDHYSDHLKRQSNLVISLVLVINTGSKHAIPGSNRSDSLSISS